MTINSSVQNIVYTAEPSAKSTCTADTFSCNTYTIVSKIAYLIGVAEYLFQNEHEPPKPEYYAELQKDKSARMIRNLCILRTAIERNFQELNHQMTYNMQSLRSCSKYIPTDALDELQQDGIKVEKANCRLNQYIIDINRHISNHINNCRRLFPLWLNWDYVKDLFIMPKGTSIDGIKKAAAEYYANLSSYPYQMYINWGYLSAGNILYNDKKFVTLLYEAHGDCFTDLSKVIDAGEKTKADIYEFLRSHEKIVIIVDCENVDPYRFCATLKNLNQEKLLEEIHSLILIDDVHTSSAWDILRNHVNIQVEHHSVKRIAERKSLVDPSLSIRVTKEHYQNHIDAFIIVSSDSDFWPLVHALPEASFLFMMEKKKCGSAIKNALSDVGITYCYLDDFCTDSSLGIKTDAMLREIHRSLSDAVAVNINDVIKDALTVTRAEMSPTEKKMFYDRYIKSMRLVIEETGNLSIQFG